MSRGVIGHGNQCSAMFFFANTNIDHDALSSVESCTIFRYRTSVMFDFIKFEHRSLSSCQNRTSFIFYIPKLNIGHVRFAESNIGHIVFSRSEIRPCSIIPKNEHRLWSIAENRRSTMFDQKVLSRERYTGRRDASTKNQGNPDLYW